MNFNETEISVLKNFAGINDSMLIRQDRFEVINNAQSCVAKYQFETEYDFGEFGIYNMPEFLSVLGLMKNPDIVVSEKFLTIKEGASKIKYFTTAKDMLPEVKDVVKKFSQVKCDLIFDLPADKLASLFKAITVLGPLFLFFETDGKKIRLTLGDQLESSNNSFDITIEDGIKNNKLTKKYNKIPVYDLKLMPGDYTVELSEKGISKWTAFNGVEYFIGVSDKP